jgi:hypothetical protein
VLSARKGYMERHVANRPVKLMETDRMERPEIAELLFSALIEPNDIEPLSPFLSRRVEWILSAADPQTLGKESPPNAIKFSGKQAFKN